MRVWLFLLWLTASVGAQTPKAGPYETVHNQPPFRVTARADKKQWELGQTVRIVYRVEGPAAANITFPAAEKTELKPLEVTDAVAVTLPAQGDRRVWEFRVKANPYETGTLSVPELKLSVRTTPEAATTELPTPAMEFEINRVPAGPNDKPDQVRDAKALAGQPIPPLLILLGLLILLLLAGLMWGVWRWLRRPRSAPAAPPLPPYEWALKELQELNTQRLDREGEWERFYERLTHVLRFYLGWRHSLPLLELTSYEILRTLTLDPDPQRQLKDILETGDLVKFARSFPAAEKGDQHLLAARELVERNAPPVVEKS